MNDEKAIKLGHPSYVWRFGQDRRLNLISKHARFNNSRILDVGCGIGAYVAKFHALGADGFGVDVDLDKLIRAKEEKGLATVSLSVSEELPFRDDLFDTVLLHEVIEHVNDDRQTIREAHRVTKRGGVVLVFAPNRLYPFETHGAYFGKRYVYGNIPLIGYMPDGLRRRFAPHVRAYRQSDLRALFSGLSGKIVTHTVIYPGYDKIAGNRAALARLLRAITYTLEGTPLRALGLSHFLVWQKS